MSISISDYPRLMKHEEAVSTFLASMNNLMSRASAVKLGTLNGPLCDAVDKLLMDIEAPAEPPVETAGATSTETSFTVVSGEDVPLSEPLPLTPKSPAEKLGMSSPDPVEPKRVKNPPAPKK